MVIRKAIANDANAIYELHVASIKHYCASSYSDSVIVAWVSSKSPDIYKNLPAHYEMLVAEEEKRIIGFGVLNLQKNSIDSVYILPDYSRKGIGGSILKNLEEIALNHEVKRLTLSSTLNAVNFYHSFGYKGNIKSTQTLQSGVSIDCINMEKVL